LVSIVVGILPAIRLSSGSAWAALNGATRGSSGQHDGLRRLIVGGEVAVSLVLICGSVLLFKSLMRLQHVDTGVRAPNVVTASIDIGPDKYPTADRVIGFYDRLSQQITTLPGVESASIAGDVPLEGTGGENLRMPGNNDTRLSVRFKRADARYFQTVGLEMVQGRAFSDADRLGAPYVTVINEALAHDIETTFGITDPVGRLVDLPAIGYQTPTVRQSMLVVGIVTNERVERDLRESFLGVAYVPIAQAPMLWNKLAIRTQRSTADITPALRDALRQIDPRVALANIRTLEELRDLSLSGLRAPAWLIGIFASLSAFLAAFGLYGVVAHSVAQQRREIGIRMALGARSNDVLSMVVRHIVTTIALGLLCGLAGAYALTRVTRSLLFEVSTLDPSAFAIAAVAMAGVGIIAALVPATRAMRVDPTTSLRSE
jgi:putative ABC transport system permease protein